MSAERNAPPKRIGRIALGHRVTEVVYVNGKRYLNTVDTKTGKPRTIRHG